MWGIGVTRSGQASKPGLAENGLGIISRQGDA